ncbi:MAG: alpha/beta fold hydrolase [Myxococcota bacterium]
MEEFSWDTRGLTLRGRVAGRPDGPPVIMLHGFLDTSASFASMMEMLGDQWRIWTPDHRGHGRSDAIGAGGYYHFPDYLLDLDGLYRHLDLEKAVLVGHSMGASIACYFAGAFPERVSGLVLLDGIGPPNSIVADKIPDSTRRWIADVRRRDAHTSKGAESLEAVARSIGRLSSRATPERLLELAKAATTKDASGRYQWRFDPLHRTHAPIAFDPVRFRAYLERITCPVLALWAETSPMHAPDEEARIAALGDVTVQTLPGTGHNMHHERPGDVAAAIRVFLSARTPIAP